MKHRNFCLQGRNLHYFDSSEIQSLGDREEPLGDMISNRCKKMKVFKEKNMIFLGKWILRSLRYENKFITPRGGLVRLFGLPWGFTSNRCLSPQKEISVGAHLLTSKNRTSKSRKIDFSEKKFEKNLNVPKFL